MQAEPVQTTAVRTTAVRTTPVRQTPVTGTIGIIGLGSRGIGVLERLVTLAARPDRAGRRLVVEVIDPDGSGVGIHAVDQPDHLLLNTVCAQVSLFPEEATVGAAVGDRGPDLYEWVTARGLKVAEDGHTLGAEGRPVRPDDFLPRRVLGEYLRWFLRRLLDRVPQNVEIRFHRATATSLSAGPDDSRLITLDSGETLRVDTVFLTTGHTPPAAHDPGAPGASRRIHEIYPPARAFEDVTAGQTVALGGTGLSAMDVLASLTLGRGGRYEAVEGGLRYLPSGREPSILLFSRTGIPFRARPADNRTDGPYRPVVFTPETLDRLRAAGGDRPLDLHGDLLPLIRAEMRGAFHRRGAALAGGTDAERALTERLRAAADEGTLDDELNALDLAHAERFGHFDPQELLFPDSAEFDSADAYRKWYEERLRSDLVEARLGLGGSPTKAGLEVLRDLRDVVRHAVDFGGLDEPSHDEFYGSFTATLNRSVTGPQLDRHEELLALLEAGIVSVPFGPAPRVEWDGTVWRISSTRLGTAHAAPADWLAYATSGQPDVEATGSPLLAGLMASGRIRRHRPGALSSRGVDITVDQHPVGADGRPDRKVRVLGPLCEGATFYNHYVPSPGGRNRALADADRCVTAVLAELDAVAAAVTETVNQTVSVNQTETETAGSPAP
ncbi:FAD/NAD(P)-binding protein [Streptomyces sp. DSM 3412]|uniref:FAD/NAD(P)-binding protein n=1 Tax=Streptomyces gottesmaniae TaxID=3075518 RepID=A0ABU2Z8B5_9ACTN|nr:FAD/NAD(P)-binding domain-containing protein [Streptomyces sp. DSM 3412]MDT0572832.1 FAD/NAD(P)-binding protein [Streptomyces sp. DSM 3412]